MASSGEIYRSLPGPLITDVYDPVFQDPRLEPLPDQADDAPVADAMFHEANEPFLVHRVEERADVGVQYEVHLPAFDSDHERIHRIMRAAPGPETVRVSRPAGFHHWPLAEPSVRTLASLGSHQANVPIIPSRQCTKRFAFSRASLSRKRPARIL